MLKTQFLHVFPSLSHIRVAKEHFDTVLESSPLYFSGILAPFRYSVLSLDMDDAVG